MILCRPTCANVIFVNENNKKKHENECRIQLKQKRFCEQAYTAIVGTTVGAIEVLHSRSSSTVLTKQSCRSRSTQSILSLFPVYFAVGLCPAVYFSSQLLLAPFHLFGVTSMIFIQHATPNPHFICFSSSRLMSVSLQPTFVIQFVSIRFSYSTVYF